MSIDSDYGPYGHCNICNPALANSSWVGKLCTPAKYGKYFCVGGHSRGKQLNTSKVGFETVASDHYGTCWAGQPEWDCWRNHLVPKIGGNWWSFFNESVCDTGQVPSQGGVQLPRQPGRGQTLMAHRPDDRGAGAQNEQLG